jgi:hypothetical protein
MERTVRYRLMLWISDLLDANYYVLSLGGDNLNDVIEMENGYVLRMD